MSDLLTVEELHSRLGEWAVRDRGALTGLPIPSTSDLDLPLVMARAVREQVPSAPKNEDAGVEVYPLRAGECLVLVEKGGALGWARVPDWQVRLGMALRTAVVRAGAVSWESEIRAALLLQSRLSDAQWASYVLSGGFAETGHSGVVYFLRRGLPTLALRSETGDRNGPMRPLAALCLHPMAYYAGTWAGSLPPSDEVLAHLLLIRTDEHEYWKRCEQHRPEDPRAGI